MTDKTEETTEFKAPKKVVAMSNKAIEAFKTSGTLVIATDDDYARAADLLQSYKAQAKELTATRVSLTKPLDVSKKGIMDFFRTPLTNYADAETTLKKAMLVYHEKLEVKRKEEEAEAARLAEKERKYQEDLAKKRLATAEKNNDAERIEEVEDEIEEIQTATVAPVVARNKPKVQGISTRETWSGEVTDKMALIKAVAAGQAPETLLDVNSKVLNQMARAMKSHLVYPGIKAVSKSGIASR